MLTNYTTADEIRAALGVSDEELENATIELGDYYRLLLIDLDEIADDLATQYEALTGSLSAAQARFQRRVQVFATYSVARVLVTSLPLFAPKRVQDGRAEQERIQDPYKDTREGVLAMYGRLRDKLVEAYAELFPEAEVFTPTTISFCSSVGLAVDPVTNE